MQTETPARWDTCSPGGSRQEAQGQRLGVCREEGKFHQDFPRNCSSVLVAGE